MADAGNPERVLIIERGSGARALILPKDPQQEAVIDIHEWPEETVVRAGDGSLLLKVPAGGTATLMMCKVGAEEWRWERVG